MSLEIYNKLRTPPKEALKQIKGGRLSGMTDISPQWRYKIMTETFGPVGFGWYFEVKEHWNEVYDTEVACFVRVSLYVKETNSSDWSMPIEGVGGSRLRTQEKNGVHVSDEGYKMATTDALSAAMKLLGVGADIYAGKWDGSKYIGEPDPVEKTPINFQSLLATADKFLSKFQDAKQALATIGETKEISQEAEAFIVEWFETRKS